MAESSNKAACDHSGDAVDPADSGVEKLGDKGDTHEGDYHGRICAQPAKNAHHNIERDRSAGVHGRIIPMRGGIAA